MLRSLRKMTEDLDQTTTFPPSPKELYCHTVGDKGGLEVALSHMAASL